MPAPTELSEDRYVDQRSSFLARTAELRKPKPRAIAWSEPGYSRGEMASEEKLDTGGSTVQGWHEKAMALYGLEICGWVAIEGEELPEYDRVGPEYFDRLNPTDALRWVEFVDRHRTRLPQGWVHDILQKGTGADRFDINDL